MQVLKVGETPASYRAVSCKADPKSRQSYAENSIGSRAFGSVPLNAHRNLALSQISFGRSLAEHNSWGAAVDPKTKDVNFKLFTFSDAKAVYVEVKPKDSEPYDESKRLEYYNDQQVYMRIKPELDKNGQPQTLVDNSQMIPLENKGDGIFEAKAGAKSIKAGDEYRFVIVNNDNSVIAVKDPYSNKQAGVFSWSEIVDHSTFKWTDKAWQTGKNNEKLSRLERRKENGLTRLSAMNLYEMHIGTITKDGTFEAAKKEVDRVKSLGFNSIHIMPVENCPDINWGYDGVDKFAPNSVYGSPEKLKELIDYAHSKKMNIIMDIVPNHKGPEGNTLEKTGPYTQNAKDAPVRWGSKPFNFEEREGAQYVRDYIVNVGRHYLDKYHCDGLRLDMTKFMDSDFTLKEIAQEINYHHPNAVLIAEDARENPRTTKAFDPLNTALNNTEQEHCEDIKRTDSDIFHKNLGTLENGIGMDSEWAFEFQHNLMANIIGDAYGRHANTGWLLNNVVSNGSKLKYAMSHDEIGNDNGTRLIQKSLAAQMNLFKNVNGNNDCEKGQKVGNASYELSKLVATGEAQKMNNEQFNEFVKNLGITRVIDRQKELYPAFENALDKHKTALGFAFATPGPTMVFQGDESASLDLFRFFREFPNQKEDYHNIKNEKGYEPGKKEAFEVSKLNNIEYSDKYKTTMKQMEAYTAALNKLATTEEALISGHVLRESSVVHKDVLGVHSSSEDGKSQIFAVSNFHRTQRPLNAEGNDHRYDGYEIAFPKGKWAAVINSDEVKYGGSGKYTGPKVVESSANGEIVSISLPSNGTAIFKKVG